MTEENFDNLPATKGDLKNFATKDDIKALGDNLKGFKKEVESSFKELGEAIQLFASHVDKRFEKLEGDVGTLKQDVTKIKATMVTKDYLDEKLGDLRGDMTVLVRKEDNKMKTLVEVLVEKEVLDQADKKRIYSLEPFAQI